MTTAVLTRPHDGRVTSPDPAPRPTRRRFTGEYKAAIVAEYDGCTNAGEKGALPKGRLSGGLCLRLEHTVPRLLAGPNAGRLLLIRCAPYTSTRSRPCPEHRTHPPAANAQTATRPHSLVRGGLAGSGRGPCSVRARRSDTPIPLARRRYGCRDRAWPHYSKRTPAATGVQAYDGRCWA